MAVYQLSNAAKEDLRRIYEYGVSHFGEHAAEKYYRGFFATFAQIAETPLRYPSVDYIRQGYRRAVYGVDSIYFRVDEQKVEIMAILGGQDFEQWL